MTYQEWLRTRERLDPYHPDLPDEVADVYDLDNLVAVHLFKPGWLVEMYGENDLPVYDLTVGNLIAGGDRLEPVARSLWEWHACHELGVPADPEWQAYSDAMHEAARRFMDAHAKPGWAELALEEWLVEYNDQLPADVRRVGGALLSCFEGYGGTA